MTFDLDPTQLADALEAHLGTRITVTAIEDGVLLTDPLSVRMTISRLSVGLFLVRAGWGMGETPRSLAMIAANAVNLGKEPLGAVAVDADGDDLGMVITVRVHGPLAPGRDFGAAINRVLATADTYFGTLAAETARVEAAAALDAPVVLALPSAGAVPNAPSGMSASVAEVAVDGAEVAPLIPGYI